MNRDNCLFYSNDWHEFTIHWMSTIHYEIDSIGENRLLNSSIEDLCNYFVEKYSLDVPVLGETQVTEPTETNINVVNGDRYVRQGRTTVPGTSISVVIEFTGDDQLFHIRPSNHNHNPPVAFVQNNNLMFSIEEITFEQDKITSEIKNRVDSIKFYLNSLRKNAKEFNKPLRSNIQTRIQNRREKILKNKKIVAGLGYKIKARESSTYSAPEIQRKKLALPSASTQDYVPEPTLDESIYDHILQVCNSMSQTMERSPDTYKKLNEESLRQFFLAVLNTHYEGKATGETFNYNGKTDILIRSEGKNIFIAECKFWNGPKQLTSTINQLLSYTSWRDTKTALLIFSRRKNFSKVLSSIPNTIKQHPNFKRINKNPVQNETEFRYIFAHSDDKNRELFLTVLVFDVPS